MIYSLTVLLTHFTGNVLFFYTSTHAHSHTHTHARTHARTHADPMTKHAHRYGWLADRQTDRQTDTDTHTQCVLLLTVDVWLITWPLSLLCYRSSVRYFWKLLGLV